MHTLFLHRALHIRQCKASSTAHSLHQCSARGHGCHWDLQTAKHRNRQNTVGTAGHCGSQIVLGLRWYVTHKKQPMGCTQFVCCVNCQC